MRATDRPDHRSRHSGSKDRRFDLARRAWRRGLALFPDDADLAERLAIEDDRRLLAFVEAARSIDGEIDTDLSFLDREP